MYRFTLVVLAAVLSSGCTPRSAAIPGPVPPGTTIEIYATSPTAGPETKAATHPTTRAVIHLVKPPVITTRDIATVARSEMEVDTGGDAPADATASLEVELTPAGEKKMLAATQTPASPGLALVVDGVVVSVPNIRTPIKGSFRVTGDDRDPAFLKALSAATGEPQASP